MFGNDIRFLTLLTMTDEELDEGLDVMTGCLAAVNHGEEVGSEFKQTRGPPGQRFRLCDTRGTAGPPSVKRVWPRFSFVSIHILCGNRCGTMAIFRVLIPMWYYRRLPDGLVIMQTRRDHAEQLEALQRLCFPTLDDAERFKAAHYRKHVELFEDGQFVVLDGDRVVGATSSIRLHFDFDHVHHTFGDIIQGGWLTSHQPAGAWLYGADLGVAPAYRGRGLGTALYAARQETVWRLGLAGQVTAGMIRDFGAVKDRMSAQDYYEGVIDGRINDSTLSMQLARRLRAASAARELPQRSQL